MATTQSTAAGTPPASGELFSRRATGLVRLGTPWRILILNFANIGLTYIWFTYWITPGVFPQSNLFLSIAIAGIATSVFAAVLAAFSSSFPRSGGEYVYVSRTLHPSIGFACSVAAALSQCFWIGIGGFWIANLVLAPVLSAIGISTGSDTLVNWGTDLGTQGAGFVVGTIAVVLCLALNLGGLKRYFRFQTVSFVVGVLTLLVLVVGFLVSSKSGFASGINELAAAGGGSENAYDDILGGAQEAGMPGGITLHDTLGIFAVTWLLAFASTYIAGEVRSPRKTQLLGTVGGSLVYTAVALLLLAVIFKAVPAEFNKAAAWMNYNSENYYEILPADPTFVTWIAALVDSTILLLVIGIGLVIWSFFWLPSAMIIATRAIFAWSMERLVPSRLSDVHPRTNAPVAATLAVAIIAELFLVAYWQEWFTYLTPFLAYACIWVIVSLAGIVAAYRPSTRGFFADNVWGRKVLGIPLIALCGIVGMLYWGIAVYYAMTADLLALNTTKQILLTGAQFAIPFVAFFAIAAWRRSRGINLSAAYAELPPE
jgi:amino acid transporter